MKLHIEEMIKSYSKKEVIKGASYTFERGEIYGILGRNGAGKTTLFNCLMGNMPIDSGSVLIEENGEKRPLDFDDIGMVSASPSLPDFLTGYEFIKCFIEIQKKTITDVKKIDDYFDLVKLSEEDRHRLIREYSFGMQNKIQLLTCLIKKPKVILLDEPLTSFDIIVSHDIKQVLIDMKDEHIILLSTHILQLAQDVCDDVVVLSNGILAETEYVNQNSDEFEEYIVSALQEVN